MTFDRGELLREAGYSEGDVIPTPGWVNCMSRDFVTSSTSYVNDPDQFDFRFRWDRLDLDVTTAVATFACRVSPGTGETVDIRLFNRTSSETVKEVTGITSANNLKPSVDTYEPADIDGSENYRFEIRTNPGSNSSVLRAPAAFFGVEL